MKNWKITFDPRCFIVGFQTHEGKLHSVCLGPIAFIRKGGKAPRRYHALYPVWGSSKGHWLVRIIEYPSELCFGIDTLIERETLDHDNDQCVIVWLHMGFLIFCVNWSNRPIYEPIGLLNRPVQKLRRLIGKTP